MLKNHPKRFLFLFVFISVIASCTKDAGSKNAETYIVSAKKIIDMTSKNWYEVEPELNDKKGYWYTEFTQDQTMGIKAAVSLPAIDDSNSNIKCHVLLNVNRRTNNVSSASVTTFDSTAKISKEEAYAMMMNYNNEASGLLTGITSANGLYGAADGIQTMTTTEDVLFKLSSGFETSMLFINYRADQGVFSLVMFRNDAGDGYSFSFDGRGF